MTSNTASFYSAAGLSSGRLSELDLRKPKPTVVSMRSPSQQRQLSRPTRFSLGSGTYYFGLRKSPPRFQLSCLRDSKAMVVTSESWEKMVLSCDIPVLVEFHASWCGPCRMVHRIIDEIAVEYSGRLKCFVLHADNDIVVADNYDVKVVPVVLLFKNGEKRETVIGTMPKEFYAAVIERVLSS